MTDVPNNASDNVVQAINGLSKAITDDVDAFYALPDDRFAQQVHQFTRNDPRLSLLFFATRQKYQQNRAAMGDPKG